MILSLFQPPNPTLASFNSVYSHPLPPPKGAEMQPLHFLRMQLWKYLFEDKHILDSIFVSHLFIKSICWKKMCCKYADYVYASGVNQA